MGQPLLTLLTLVSFGTSVLLAPFSSWWALWALAPFMWTIWLFRSNCPTPKWLGSLALCYLLTGVPELALRASDFRHEMGVEFGFPRPTFMRTLKHDERFFWTLNPSLPGVNQEGFLGQDITPKKDGTFRILYLGDSVFHQRIPEQVHRLLHQQGLNQIETFNFSIPGYTSFQGKRVYDAFADQINPDLVVVLFGWNDHWLAYGAPDKDKRPAPPPSVALQKIYSQLRLLQALVFLRGKHLVQDQPRVSLSDYPEHLQHLKTPTHQTLFLTAPSAHEKLGVPPHLRSRHFVKDKNDVITLHKAYNQALQNMEGIWLLDVAERWAGLSAEEQKTLFTRDGIHLTPKGVHQLATLLAKTIKDTCFP